MKYVIYVYLNRKQYKYALALDYVRNVYSKHTDLTGYYYSMKTMNKIYINICMMAIWNALFVNKIQLWSHKKKKYKRNPSLIIETIIFSQMAMWI